MSTGQKMELLTVTLGLEPFILIKLEEGADGTPSFDFNAGGGIAEKDELIALLIASVELLTGVAGTDYVAKINEKREREGQLHLLAERNPE